MATFEVIFDSDPKITTESIYGITKELAKSGRLKTENIEALAELMGEFSGEQKG